MKRFAALGEGCHIEPPLAANLGGMFVHFGRNVYANFGFTLVDDAPIYVGDGTLFGPNVTLTTAGHPIDPERRGIFFASRFISAETAGSARTAPLRAIFRPTSSHTAARAGVRGRSRRGIRSFISARKESGRMNAETKLREEKDGGRWTIFCGSRKEFAKRLKKQKQVYRAGTSRPA